MEGIRESRRPARAQCRRSSGGAASERPLGPAQPQARALTRPAGTDWALGVEARCRALVGDGRVAEDLYREVIAASDARGCALSWHAHLLYGEWLRRESRRTEARDQLRAAHQHFTTMGTDGFGERVAREVLATGERIRRRTGETGDDLSPQERQIAQLLRDGLSNPEIGTRPVLSPRAVEWHLHKVFTKLGISSRRELRGAVSVSVPFRG